METLCPDSGQKMHSFRWRGFFCGGGVTLDRVKLHRCPPGGDNFPLFLMSRWTSNQPFSIWLRASQAAQRRLYSHGACGTPTVMWTSFCCLRYVGTLRGGRKKRRERERAVSYSRLCKSSEKNASDFNWSTVAQKNGFTFLTFPVYKNHIMYLILGQHEHNTGGK